MPKKKLLKKKTPVITPSTNFRTTANLNFARPFYKASDATASTSGQSSFTEPLPENTVWGSTPSEVWGGGANEVWWYGGN